MICEERVKIMRRLQIFSSSKRLAAALSSLALLCGGTHIASEASFENNINTASAAITRTALVNGDFQYPSDSVIQPLRSWSGNEDSYNISPDHGTLNTNIDWQGSAVSIPGFDKDKFGWRSTQTLVEPGVMEIQRHDLDDPHNLYVELCAFEAGTAIYQDINTVPGSVYKWSLRHSSLSRDYLDKMQVLIGAVGKETVSPATRIASATGQTIGETSDTIATTNSYETQDENRPMWGKYTGTYLVPSGQTITRFTFKSIDSRTAALGNLIDDVSFDVSYPLVYDTNGGSVVSGKTLPDPKSNNYSGYYVAGKKANLVNGSAYLSRSGYSFLGWSSEKTVPAVNKATYDANKAKCLSQLTIQAKTENRVYAVWAKNPTVTFKSGYGNNGTLKTQVVKPGGNATEPSTPTRTGYVFTGYDSAYTSVYADTTTTAQWRTAKYTIHYDKNNNAATGSTPDQSMNYDTAANLNANRFSLVGHSWTGWNTKPDGTGTSYRDGQSVTNLTAVDGSTVTLYAQWSINKYPVTFVDGYGTTLSSEQVSYGSAASEPQRPSRSGYTFTGWDKSFSNITQATTITAQWHANSYVVRYNRNTANAAATGSMQDQDMVYDVASNLSANAFSWSGHTWRGWNTKPDGSGDGYSDQQSVINLTNADSGIVTLYAQWDINSYPVVFRTGYGDNSVINTQSVLFEQAASEPQHPSRTGYNFVGWDKSFTKITQATTVTAQWAPINYKIRFDKNAATASGSMPDQSLEYDKIANLSGNSFTRTGYKWTRWNTRPDGTGTSYEDGQTIINLSSGDGTVVTLYAQWEANGYAISYNKNAGDDASGSMADQNMIYDKKAKLSKNAFTRTGYTWTGWNILPDGSGTGYSEQQEVMNLSKASGGKVILYAQWKINSYKVTFTDGNGSTLSEQNVDYGKSATAPAQPGKTGYTFDRWDKRFDRVTENLTVNAAWRANNYVIRYDGNASAGLHGSMSDQQAAYDSSIILSGNTFSRTGYTWQGWNTRADGSGSSFSDKQTVRNLTDKQGGIVTLYAQWKPINYIVRFNKNDSVGMTVASGNMNDQSMIYDKAEALSYNKFSRVGYHYAGWNTKSDGSGRSYQDKQQVVNLSDSNGGIVTLYAQWVIDEFTVKFVDGNGNTLKTENVSYGGTATSPDIPKKPGYRFAGWDKQFDNVTSDLTVTARWSVNGYQVRFNHGAPNVTGMMSNQQFTVDKSDSLSANRFSRVGYTWQSWNTSAGGNGNSFSDKQQVLNLAYDDGVIVDLFAQWKANNYSIRYNSNGGSGSMELQKATYDESVTIKDNGFERSGYDFSGWNTERDGSGKSFASGDITSNLLSDNNGIVDLFAQWTPHKYIIRFNKSAVNARGIMEDQSAQYDEIVSLNRNKFVLNGYQFRGWSTKAGETGIPNEYADGDKVKNLTPDDNGVVNLYAIWSENAPVSIKYIASDEEHSSVSASSENVSPSTGNASGSTAKVSDGYHFVGWSDVSGTLLGKNEVFVPTRGESGLWEPATYYASCEPNEYTIDYVANGQKTTGEMKNQNFVYDKEEALVSNRYEREGYTFIGWNTKADGTGKTYDDCAIVKNLTKENGSTIKLYAQWKQNKYNIIFDKNDAGMITPVNGLMPDQPMVFDEEANLNKNEFSSEAYDFAGWNTDPSGNGTPFIDEQTVMNLVAQDNGKIKLYAQWRIKTFDVEFTDGNGNSLGHQTVSWGDAAIPPAVPSIDAKKFSGWDTSYDNVTHNLIVNAIWSDAPAEQVASDEISETSDQATNDIIARIAVIIVMLTASSFLMTCAVRRECD